MPASLMAVAKGLARASQSRHYRLFLGQIVLYYGGSPRALWDI